MRWGVYIPSPKLVDISNLRHMEVVGHVDYYYWEKQKGSTTDTIVTVLYNNYNNKYYVIFWESEDENLVICDKPSEVMQLISDYVTQELEYYCDNVDPQYVYNYARQYRINLNLPSLKLYRV